MTELGDITNSNPCFYLKVANELNYYTGEEFLEVNNLTIERIIKEAVHAYGKEPYHNIIIKDLDKYGLE